MFLSNAQRAKFTPSVSDIPEIILVRFRLPETFHQTYEQKKCITPDIRYMGIMCLMESYKIYQHLARICRLSQVCLAVLPHHQPKQQCVVGSDCGRSVEHVWDLA